MMLYIEPYAGVTPIVQVINSAKKEVNLNVYLMTDNQIIQALKNAGNRGVKVRVILDGKPYGMSAAKVNREVAKIKGSGINVKFAPARFEKHGNDYVFDHAKYVCNSHECEIGTANYSYSAFRYNREYLIVTHNANLVSETNHVFDSDWNNQVAGSKDMTGNLVVSPHSLQKMLAVINQPGIVYIESEELGNERQILSALSRKGKQAYIILPNTVSSADMRNVEDLISHGVNIKLMPKNKVYMHAKMMVGDAYAFIGSENFSYSSLMKNREMGVILHSSTNLQKLRTQFQSDWSNSAPVQDSSLKSAAHSSYTEGGDHWYHKDYHHDWHHDDWHHDDWHN